MDPRIDVEKLADVQRVASKLERLPDKLLMYVAGYVDCAVTTVEQSHGGKERERVGA